MVLFTSAIFDFRIAISNQNMHYMQLIVYYCCLVLAYFIEVSGIFDKQFQC
jgi:hypothetical protein